MKKHILYILVSFFASTSILFTGCLKNDDIEPTPLAGLTMVNGYPDDLAVIYYADGQAILPLEYKSFSGVAVVTGNRNLIVKEYNSNQILVDTSFVFQDSTFYSSFAFGTTDNPKHVLTVDKTLPSLEGAGIRFFNLSSGVSGSVSLQIDDQPIPSSFNNRAVESQASILTNQNFISQSAGTFTLTVTDGTGSPIATRESVKLNADRYYSIILIGKNGDGDMPLYIGIIDQVAN